VCLIPHAKGVVEMTTTDQVPPSRVSQVPWGARRKPSKPPRRHSRWLIFSGIAAVLLLGAAVAGCGTASTPGSTPSSSPAVQQARPGNPVAILSRTGARVPSSTVYGEVDPSGYRYATGYFRVLGQRNAEKVTVCTFATTADMQRYLRQNPPSDTKIGIQGNGLFVVQVMGMRDKTMAMVYSVTPTQIALRVGGTLIGGPRSFTRVSAYKPKQHIRAVPPAGAPAQPAPPAAPYVDPVTVVQNFYDALARGDYQTAWNLGGKNIGGLDYNSWVAAYATTAGVYGTASDLGGGGVQVSFSAVQADGSVKTFAGTYTVLGGVIVAANITQTS
jgi:hypothetical protein